MGISTAVIKDEFNLKYTIDGEGYLTSYLQVPDDDEVVNDTYTAANSAKSNVANAKIR